MSDDTQLTGRFVVPEIVATHFLLREGDKVADFGAGKGHFAPILSKIVGPTGRVYSCEIQKNLVEAIADMLRTNGLSNVEAVWCDIETHEGTKLEENLLDAAILVNTLFQMEDKRTALQEIKRTLRPGGKLLLVDWSESFGGLGPQPQQVVGQQEAKALCEVAGFVFERSYDAGDHHYGLAFKNT